MSSSARAHSSCTARFDPRRPSSSARAVRLTCLSWLRDSRSRAERPLFAEGSHLGQQRLAQRSGAVQEQCGQLFRRRCPARGFQGTFGRIGRAHACPPYRGVVGVCAQVSQAYRRGIGDVRFVEQSFEQVAIVDPTERRQAYAQIGIPPRAGGDLFAEFLCLFGCQRLDGAEPFVSAR